MSKPDPFGFSTAAVESAGLDIDVFAPKSRRVDRPAVDAAREVARDAGFTRRAPRDGPEPSRDSAAAPIATPPTRGRKRRVNITQVLGLTDRFPETERAQLNLLAPVPIVMRWRALVQAHQVPAWEILDAAMDALAASGVDPTARARTKTGA